MPAEKKDLKIAELMSQEGWGYVDEIFREHKEKYFNQSFTGKTIELREEGRFKYQAIEEIIKEFKTILDELGEE